MTLGILRLSMLLTVVIVGGGSATVASLTQDGILGVTEGQGNNRRSVVGTYDINKDVGVMRLGALPQNGRFGIFGRIVWATDAFDILP